MLVKVYLSNVIYSKTLFGPIQLLVSRFAEYELF